MTDEIDRLRQNVRIDEKFPPYLTESLTEPACPSLWSPWCPSLTFHKQKHLVRYNDSFGDMSIHIERQVLRRAINTQRKHDVSLTRTTSKISVSSSTTGWTIGADVTADGNMGVKAGVKVSATYSSSTTESMSITVTDSSRLSCPPRHRCWSEGWTAYLTVRGTCSSHPRLEMCGRMLYPCRGPLARTSQCEQVERWRDGVCDARRVFGECSVTTPIMEGEKPYFNEVFFEETIDGGGGGAEFNETASLDTLNSNSTQERREGGAEFNKTVSLGTSNSNSTQAQPWHEDIKRLSQTRKNLKIEVGNTDERWGDVFTWLGGGNVSGSECWDDGEWEEVLEDDDDAFF
ncbi:hypothetical protein GQ602_001523 [Ophiocordyceps camponoti-floridani]|uniref:Uncharacterized protein n=1 Tax=Ophiocordyceps camponoti-floridani TaxID=2030778 RepID=A0A8H4QE68_9HYPO|nr:hypothetical protein GQ602_001523 [Ophiocordyceps camponoti-floridani]